jgi:hypothetical protein
VPTEPYPTVTANGVDYWSIPCLVAKESDPENGAYVYFAKPLDGVSGISGLVKGDPGKHTEIQSTVDFTPLAYDDPTAASMSMVEVTPGSDTVSQVVKVVAALHEGEPGTDGTTSLDLDSITGTAAAGKSIVVNSGVDGFDYTTPWVGGMHWPATVTEASAQTAGVTLATITVASNTYLSDWRTVVFAGTTITGSTADVQVDLIARLNAADGPVIGRASGVNGTFDKLVIIPGPDTGAASTVNKVTAGAAATVYIRAEKQSGTATFSTSNTRCSLVAVRA